MDSNRLELLDVSKSFSGVPVLKNVSVVVKRGEVHALLGENGAGKSTLIKILSGAYRKDSGKSIIDGREVNIRDPFEGKRNGIGVVYQEFTLANDLTVAENIFLDQLSEKGFIHWRSINRKAVGIIKDLGFEINPKSLVGELSVANKQIVEIAKALTVQAKILVLDEPTTVLAPGEVKDLFKVIKKIKERGTSIIYISHRLPEIFEIADNITVLKDGEIVGTRSVQEVDMDQLINMMIGRSISNLFPEKEYHNGELVCEVKEYTRKGIIEDISFSVRKGEILGFAGLVGSGRSEVMRALFGADMIDKGTLFLEGRKTTIDNTSKALKNKIAFVPEDRKEEGAILENSVAINMTLAILKRIKNKLGFLSSSSENKYCDEMIKKFNIKTHSLQTLMENLSGGNQQKVILAKWFLTNAKLLILDEPTRGVDVGAKSEIYELIKEMAKETGIIIVSSEMMEVIGLSHRVAVMREGRISKILEKDEISEVNIMKNAVPMESVEI
ncbi:MAG: sugar ABC transporter ATP-binding protein [SAR324 cluster bacterium]|nr:sugar ABC transporter ATP-binding protein [SAR324 cluster bacterium]